MRVYTGGGVGPKDSEFYWRMNERGWDEEQMRRSLEAGHNADSIRRHLRAMRFGGCTTAEAFSIIRDRDCAYRGTGIELWDVADVPRDRWFRNAWRRSKDGGGIWTDIDIARLVQQRKAVVAVEEWNLRQKRSPELWGHNGPHFIDAPYGWLKRKCEAARDLNELRTVWPEGLPCH